MMYMYTLKRVLKAVSLIPGVAGKETTTYIRHYVVLSVPDRTLELPRMDSLNFISV